MMPMREDQQTAGAGMTAIVGSPRLISLLTKGRQLSEHRKLSENARVAWYRWESLPLPGSSRSAEVLSNWMLLERAENK
jgi:hypothetical protein